ncbi:MULTISPECIES: DUF2691 family protein [Bacillus cereus group]|uniref:DUF2691 family protein n=1 Tax=Bacillus cereus group TaxID=86661 RepID=UPI001C0324A8|nr:MULTISPECIES: DUF2691 family protein [Bacillus cereus group]QWH38112.1 DUF2691 family protein [Bacillus mycoides]WJE25135.1 DUF2691 family protein [Bacillus cereus]
MKRGIFVDIPNEYDNLLWKVLKPVNISSFDWWVGSEESYLVARGGLDEALFPEEPSVVEGIDLKNLFKDNVYYLIFADLKAYPKGEEVVGIETYEEFKESKCELVLLVVDCTYVTVYAKDQKVIKALYENAQNLNFYVEYVTDENDGRTRLSV